MNLLILNIETGPEEVKTLLENENISVTQYALCAHSVKGITLTPLLE